MKSARLPPFPRTGEQRKMSVMQFGNEALKKTTLCVTGAPVGGSTVTQVYTRCSDPNVILDCKPTQPGEPHDIFVKVCVCLCEFDVCVCVCEREFVFVLGRSRSRNVCRVL